MTPEPPTGDVVVLDAAEAEAVTYVLGRLIRDAAVAGRPTPYSVRALYGRLCSAVSRSRQRKPLGLTESELIGTREAAELLGWNQRRVQRRWADLDGRRAGSRLVFCKRTVAEYAKNLAQQGE